MFALRRTAISAAVASRAAIRPQTVIRPFSALGARFGISASVSTQFPSPSGLLDPTSAQPPAHSHDDANALIGPGAKPGTVPTDVEQATGLERLELLAKLEGREFFDMAPLQMTHLGTKKNPVVVKSQDHHRYIGCTGYPVDSHDTIWITVTDAHEFDRCPECGSVFKLDFQGVDEPHGHH